MAPHNCYRCAGEDNWVSIAVADDEEWKALCEAMGMPELSQDERFIEQRKRWQNQTELDEIITHWTRNKDYYQVMQTLQKVGIAAAPVLSAKGLYEDPHLRERRIFRQIQHPEAGHDWVVAPPWRLSATPAAIRRHSPLIGEHNHEIFHGLLGMSADEINHLEEEEVIV